MRKQLALGFLVLVAAAGCGDGVVGDPAKGKVLFNTGALGTAKLAGCFTCHSVVAGVKVNGPSLAGFGTKALAEFKEHNRSSAQDFVKWSITSPDEEIAPDFTKDIMSKDYGTALTATELDDLSAYLMSLK
jgi:nitric oxide reductase subunit C